MPSQHTRLRALVRTELRSLLSDLLAALPPVGPVQPSPPAEQRGAVAAALDAWGALGGAGRGLTAQEALDAGRERPVPWEAFCGAVVWLRGEAVARRLLAGDGSAKDVGEVLRRVRGRMVGERVMVGDLNRTTKVMRWRVAGGASLDVAPGRVAS